MRLKRRDFFTTIRSEGSILPADLLQRISHSDSSRKGLKAEDYHLRSGILINEQINRSWNNLLSDWKTFRKRRQLLPADEPGMQIARERWLYPLFEELDYVRLPSFNRLKSKENSLRF